MWLMGNIIGLDNGLAPNRQQANILRNYDIFQRRKYAVQGGNEFTFQVPASHVRDQDLVATEMP